MLPAAMRGAQSDGGVAVDELAETLDANHKERTAANSHLILM